MSRAAMNLSRVVYCALLAFLTASCVSVPQYDSETDKQITDLQKSVDTQFVQLISLSRMNDPDSKKKRSYAQNIAFYNKVDTDLTSLELRMEAAPDPSTANLPTIFDNLREEFKEISAQHQKDDSLPEPVLVALRNQMNAQFAVLLTYELSLKGVSSPSSSSTQSTSTKASAGKASTKK